MSISSRFPDVFPSLLLDFQNSKRLDPRITFARASSATYFDDGGVLQSAAAGQARFDHNPINGDSRGFLIEEQRTNSIRNNTMQGAAAGTPGTLPTNWGTQNVGGVARTEVVGVGVENGITYVDIRYAGTTSSTATGGIITEDSSVAASTGQTWTSSFYVRLVGGSTAGLTSISNGILERDSGGNLLAQTNTTITPTNAALNTQRVSTTRTLSNASTALVQQRVAILPQSGVAIDITLRIGLPQLEQGAFATSVIPTTTTALTRSADVASMTGTNFSSWYNASEGTFYAQAERSSANSVSFCPFAVGQDTNNFITVQFLSSVLAGGSGNWGGRIRSTGDTPFTNLPASPAVTTNSAKLALSKDGTAYALSVNGGAIATFGPSGNAPSTTEARIGTAFTASTPTGAGWIQRILYWPARLANSQLQALTA